MSDEKTSRLRRYGGTALGGLLLAVVILVGRGIGGLSPEDTLVALADAFTVPGLLLICAGGMVFVSNQGAFNGVGYSMSRIVNRFIPGRNSDYESYGSYVERKSEREKSKFGYFLIVGGAYLAVGIAFTVAYLLVSE